MTTSRFFGGRALGGFGAVLLAVAATVACGGEAQAQFTGKAGAITVTLTVPEGATRLRGVLAFTATGLGSGWANNPEFRALARRLSVGVVAVRGANEFGDASYPTRCAKGEFKWLLDAIAEAARASNHPELTHAPIAGGGHSHGGDYWNYFNACYPERMALVFCKASGGVQYSKGALRTPMIWETGTNDMNNSRGNFRAAMMSHRELGTQMALILGPGEGHGGFTPGSRQMVIDLIEGIFNLRVPAVVDASAAPVTLFDIDEMSGRYWIGDNYTKEIYPFASFPTKDALARTSFLPSEDVARKWKAYGAPLPASITIDKGRCISCYTPLADEPAARPINAGPPPASVTDAGATDAGSSSGAADAGTSATPATPPPSDPAPAPDAAPAGPAPAPSPSPTGMTPMTGSGPSPPTGQPARPVNTGKSSVSGGCTTARGTSQGSAFPLIVLLVACAAALGFTRRSR